MLVVADFNQFSGQFFFFKTRGCRCFLFPRVDYSLHNHYYYRPLVHLNSQRIIIIMNGQKSGSSVPQLQSSSPLSERQFFFPTDHNCSTLTLQCKLPLKEGIQLHNMSEQKANNTSHIYDYINDILPVSQEIYNTQSVSAERKGSNFL